MMHAELTTKAQHYFQQQLGISLDELLLPIETERPTGKSVRGNGVYSAIREARREDDPTLPLGAWTHELKQADWDKVSDIAAHALMSKSKDLQLAAWLMEAQINKAGFEAIAACITLMDSLCNRYWIDLYPRIDEDDQDYRANVVRWVNEKLLPLLRLLPITQSGKGPREYGWSDFEQAKRNEQLRAMQGRQQKLEIEGVSLAEFQSSMSATATEIHTSLYRTLADALEALEMFAHSLNELWGEAAPSLNMLASLLEQIQALVAAELYKRGVRLAAPRGKEDKRQATPATDNTENGSGNGDESGGGDDDGPIRSRADAYRRLAIIADYLASIEPHSPVPCLLKRANEWGNMDTSELYYEVFVKGGGNLSIFELLGINQQEGK